MVVLAASIVTKSGKALVSRQYADMSRIRIEGLLAAFPKLVGSGKQHTYVETENVRYVYQPIEGMFLLLVTTRGSNILEDLDTLRLLAKLVPEYTGTVPDEDAVVRAAFDLIFAFDEAISHGHKEAITVQQVKSNCEMESHEEKLHKMIIQSKINDTKDIMKRKALEIDKHKMETRRGGMPPGPGYSPGLGGLGGSGTLGGSGLGGGRLDVDSSAPSLSVPGISGSGGGYGGAAPAARGGAAPPKKGMQLGKAKGGASSLLESLAREEGVPASLLEDPPGPVTAAAAAGGHVISDPVFISIDEKLSVVLSRTGGLESLEVQGTMSLVVADEAHGAIVVRLRQGAGSGGAAGAGFQFKTHPNIDKAGYADGVLGLKDPGRPFPAGTELGVLKWRLQSRDESLVPLSISAWPSASGGQTYVTLEYESGVSYDLADVVIAIPLRGGPPTVNQVDGDWRYDSRRGALLWSITLIDDTNRSGSLEFVVPATEPEAFYPIDVSFSSSTTLADVAVDAVLPTGGEGLPVKYGSRRGLSAAHYQVV